MKILLVSANSQYIHASPAPWCLKAGIEKNSKEQCEVSVFECTVNEKIRDVFEKIIEENPQIVSFSCYIWNINFVLKLAEMVKSELGCTIVLGGPEVTFNSETTVNKPFVDYVVCGEGEKPLAELCDAIISGNEVLIDGVCSKNKTSVPYLPQNNDFNYNLDEYCQNLNGRIAYIETSRGCPYSCAFCLSSSLGKTRFTDLEQTFKDIIKVSNSSAKTIKFVDRTFNANKERAKKIFRFIIKNYGKEIPSGKTFHFEIAGDILDDETIEILKTSPRNLFRLEIGLQSFNEKTLQMVNRKTETKKLINNINKLIKLNNLIIHIDLIAGLPCEDFNSFANSFNIAFYLDANELQLGFLKLLHGTVLCEQYNNNGFVYSKAAPYEVVKTPWIEKSELNLIKCCEDSTERLINSGRFTNTVNYLFKEIGLNPFSFLTNFGVFALKKHQPIYEYVNLIYLFFKDYCDCEKLRDCLLIDLFTSCRCEKVPSLLYKEDKMLKTFKNFLESEETTKRKQNTKRRVFALYHAKKFAYVDYKEKNENGKYEIHYVDFCKIKKTP